MYRCVDSVPSAMKRLHRVPRGKRRSRWCQLPVSRHGRPLFDDRVRHYGTPTGFGCRHRREGQLAPPGDVECQDKSGRPPHHGILFICIEPSRAQSIPPQLRSCAGLIGRRQGRSRRADAPAERTVTPFLFAVGAATRRSSRRSAQVHPRCGLCKPLALPAGAAVFDPDGGSDGVTLDPARPRMAGVGTAQRFATNHAGQLGAPHVGIGCLARRRPGGAVDIGLEAGLATRIGTAARRADPADALTASTTARGTTSFPPERTLERGGVPP